MRKLVASALVASAVLMMPAFARAGIDSSPFRPAVAAALRSAWERVAPFAGPVGAPGTANDVLALLESALADPSRSTGYLAARTAEVVDRLSALLVAPVGAAVDPDIAAGALDAMREVLLLGFATPPAQRSAASEAGGLLERITAVLFAPQPEPPKEARLAALAVVSGIAGIITRADATDVAEARDSIGAIARVVAVLFAPQPEPPKFARELFEVFGAMARVPQLNPAATPGTN